MERAVPNLVTVRNNVSARIVLSVASVILSGATTAGAATFYVDGNCPSDGNGLALACAAIAGGPGPKKTIDGGLALLSLPGDVLTIRGVHPAHDGESVTFDGRYFSDRFLISGKHGSSLSSLVIRPYNYSGPGTGETVYIDGTTLPSSDWTQCTNCGSGTCAGVPGTCNETWFATDSGLASRVVQAQKSDGSPTFKVTSPADLTNSHAGYNAKRCSGEGWRACSVSTDCRSGETCTGSSPEIDSYSNNTGGPLLVRWGTGANAPKAAGNPNPRVFFDNNGVGFWITNSTFVIIQGFTFRAHDNSAVLIVDESGPVNNISVANNRILYNIGRQAGGSDYGIAVYRAGSAKIAGNEIAWTGSEGIHSQCSPTGSALIVSGNWIHHQGDLSVMGTAATGTPGGTIFGDDLTMNGNYSGSVAENNLIENTGGYSIDLEDYSNGWIIRNNIFRNTVTRGCLKLDANEVSVSNSQIYNNLFINCGTGGGGPSPGIYATVTSGKSLQNNLIYNNTFVNNLSGAIYLANSGTVSGNVFRNNIMYDQGDKQMVSWPAADTFTNNIVFSAIRGSTSTLVGFNGTNYSCSVLANLSSTNKCADPKLWDVTKNDFHLFSTSPAIDAGTLTGMPAGRSTSINNTLASLYGLPPYADNLPMSGSGWDVGAAEFVGSAAPTATLTLSDPSPTAPGNVTVTLNTSVPVASVPGPLTFLENDGTTTTITLGGSFPGSTFSGIFIVDSSVADGNGSFSLPPNSLVDISGNRGNTIVSGAQTTIDKTPPVAPLNLRLGP